jgi:hypothetical protein
MSVIVQVICIKLAVKSESQICLKIYLLFPCFLENLIIHCSIYLMQYSPLLNTHE